MRDVMVDLVLVDKFMLRSSSSEEAIPHSSHQPIAKIEPIVVQDLAFKPVVDYAFRASLEQFLIASGSHPVALVWIDLLNIRRAFFCCGWNGAVDLARRVTTMLHEAVDPEALFGIIGGDSFLVAMKAAKNCRQSRQRIQSLVDVLAAGNKHDLAMRPETAAGVAFFREDTDSIEELYRFASLAAGRAAYLKSKTVVAFQQEMNSEIERSYLLEVEMRKCLRSTQFSIYYQPKVDLFSGEILGAEALIRWKHPQLGTITPTEFIPIAEHSDLIHQIFDFGLRTALADRRRWQQQGLEVPLIALNASAANVRSAGFVRLIQRTLAAMEADPNTFELEITESLAIEDEALFRKRLRQLRAIGVRVAIDDFGTRYTGFDLLKGLPLNVMKVDRCFISGMDRSPDMQALCRTIVAMAKQLKLNTVAEGIEELGELRAVREAGCDAGQGFLFQRPVPAEEFTRFLKSWPTQRKKFGFGQSAPQEELLTSPLAAYTPPDA